MNRQSAFNAIFLLVTVCAVLVFWRAYETPQIQVAQRPVANATVKWKVAPEMVQALESSEKVILYSLDPHLYMTGFKPANEHFHNYIVFGKTELSGTRRNAVVKAVFEGIDWSHAESFCFSPRHGLRIKHGGKNLDLVICFHCEQTLVTANENTVRDRYIGIAKTSEPVFDELLTEAGIKLAPK